MHLPLSKDFRVSADTMHRLLDAKCGESKGLMSPCLSEEFRTKQSCTVEDKKFEILSQLMLMEKKS